LAKHNAVWWGDVMQGTDGGRSRRAHAHNLRNVTRGSNTKRVELSANTISGNVSFTSNKGGGPFPEDVNPSIEANQITGNLACTSNTPAASNNTRPNTVGGLRSGQCGAGF
jgi:hypothetical protein